MKEFPDAYVVNGEVLDILTDDCLPNYSGLCLNTVGVPAVMWTQLRADGGRDWWLVNSGSQIVQAELDKFMKENF